MCAANVCAALQILQANQDQAADESESFSLRNNEIAQMYGTDEKHEVDGFLLDFEWPLPILHRIQAGIFLQELRLL